MLPSPHGEVRADRTGKLTPSLTKSISILGVSQTSDRNVAAKPGELRGQPSVARCNRKAWASAANELQLEHTQTSARPPAQ